MSLRCFTLMVTFLGSSAMLQAQDAASAEPSQAASDADIAQTHDEIRLVRDALIAAVNGKDVEALLPLLHEEVVLTAQDGNELKTIRSRDGVRDYLTRLLTGPDAGVQEMTVAPVVDELTILHGDDTGIAYGHSTDTYVLKDGSEFTLKTRWTSTLVKTDTGWQVASLQVSSNLFDNPVLGALSRLLGIACLIAGLVGIAIGFGITVLIKRRKNAASATAGS